MNTDEKLIYMANQIEAFFAAQGASRAVAGIAEHLNKYWTPGMRSELVALAARTDTGLKPYVRDAVKLVDAKMRNPSS
jgi:formate dehydrogenase subunit delta